MDGLLINDVGTCFHESKGGQEAFVSIGSSCLSIDINNRIAMLPNHFVVLLIFGYFLMLMHQEALDLQISLTPKIWESNESVIIIGNQLALVHSLSYFIRHRKNHLKSTSNKFTELKQNILQVFSFLFRAANFVVAFFSPFCVCCRNIEFDSNLPYIPAICTWLSELEPKNLML